MENNQPNQNQHCVIPTERSDEGSLTSVAFGPYGRRTSFQDDTTDAVIILVSYGMATSHTRCYSATSERRSPPRKRW